MHFFTGIIISALAVCGACASTVNLPAEGKVFTATPESPAYASQILQLASTQPAVSEKEPTDVGANLPYVCPMHPDVQSDKPGKCPKCGMKLEMREKHEHQEGSHEHH